MDKVAKGVKSLYDKYSPFNDIGSGTSGANQKNHHHPYGPEGPIPGRAYPAVMPKSAGDPVHKPGETPKKKKDKKED